MSSAISIVGGPLCRGGVGGLPVVPVRTNLLSIFERLNGLEQTILMVTHSSMAASYAERVLFIKDGELYNQIYRGESTRREFFERIVSTLSLLSDGGVDVG